MTRLLMMWVVAAVFMGTCGDGTWAEVAPELRRIQRELGGSAVREYSELWGAKAEPGDGAKPQAAADPRQAAGAVWASDSEGRQRDVTFRVEALREAAAQLDETANRLERLELYSQADGLREQAQRLRVDARRMSSDGRPVPAPAADALRPPMLSDPPTIPELQHGPTPENEQPAPMERSALPQLDPVPQERQEEGELTPMPLSE